MKTLIALAETYEPPAIPEEYLPSVEEGMKALSDKLTPIMDNQNQKAKLSEMLLLVAASQKAFGMDMSKEASMARHRMFQSKLAKYPLWAISEAFDRYTSTSNDNPARS